MVVSQEIVNYLVGLLAGTGSCEAVYYGRESAAHARSKVIIIPSGFFEEGVYGTRASLPSVPFSLINNTPVLFGDSRIERKKDRIILYADIIASSYFMLSRYEEMIKRERRDIHKRFLAKDSIVFKQGYGLVPIVDEYGILLRELLREYAIKTHDETKGFSKIYLTHDIDRPFKYPTLKSAIKQKIANVIRKDSCEKNVLLQYFDLRRDEYFTFPKILEYDNNLVNKINGDIVKPVYFIISRKNRLLSLYRGIKSRKFKKLVGLLKSYKVEFGLHVSYKAGEIPEEIKCEKRRLEKVLSIKTSKSRHHGLRWIEPEDVDCMEDAGVMDDFTMGYADSIGFRVGTCRPYRFINPVRMSLTKVTIHPMEIMECTLDRKNYMNVSYEQALFACKRVIKEVYKNNGELVLLWHNTEFVCAPNRYQNKLYEELLEYIHCLSSSGNV